MEKTTTSKSDVGDIEFCLIGRVVKAEVIRCDQIRLTYSDHRTALIGGDNYGDTLFVNFTYPEPSSANR